MSTTDLIRGERGPRGQRMWQAAEAAYAAVAGVWRAARNRRSVNRLLDWDDNMLRDIGLTRGDLHSALAADLTDDPSHQLARLAGERRRASMTRRSRG